MKDCKCGRRIPSAWARCGECQELRMKVETDHTFEASTYRAKVAKRHAVAKAVARVLPKPEPVEKPKTPKGPTQGEETITHSGVVPVTSEKQLDILRLMQRIRHSAARRNIAAATHAQIPSALRDWMSDTE